MNSINYLTKFNNPNYANGRERERDRPNAGGNESPCFGRFPRKISKTFPGNWPSLAPEKNENKRISKKMRGNLTVFSCLLSSVSLFCFFFFSNLLSSVSLLGRSC
jgi:hypothetical protein